MISFGWIKKSKLLISGFLLMFVLIFLALLAPAIAPNNPFEIHLDKRVAPPGYEYPAGTDHLGRCVLSRAIHGARFSLLAGLGAALMAMLPGLAVGLAAGLMKARFASFIMWGVDVMLAFPALIPALVLTGVMGPSMKSAVLGVAFAGWAWWARFVRGQVLSAKEKEFVQGGRAVGVGGLRLVRYYILPQILPGILVAFSLSAGGMIVAISGLSYLGLGAQPPSPEWGAMLKEAGLYMGRAPWMFLIPGFCVMVAVLAFNLLGEGLRDLLQIRNSSRW